MMPDAVAADAALASPPAKRVACVGRFMIDLPAGAEVLGLNQLYAYGDIISERTALDAKGFEALMLKREKVVQGEKIDYYKYAETRRIGSAGDWIFVSEKDVFGETVRRLEIHAWRNGIHFSLAPTSERPLNDALNRITDLILSKLRYRAPNEIPTDPGLCIEDGFIASNGSPDHGERVQLSLKFAKWPELSLSIDSQMVYKPEPSLIERVDAAPIPGIFKNLFMGIKNVRKGQHDVGPISGEEYLSMVPTEADYKLHQFRWESHFVVNDPYKPMVSIELATGRNPAGMNKRPTINEKDAIQLFDAVVNSLRLRPTSAPPAKVSEAPPLAPLGDLQATGRICPQTGWWQCTEEALPVKGNRMQFFRQGEAMPRVTLLGEPSMLDRLKGRQPEYSTATVWKLVKYERPVETDTQARQQPDPLADADTKAQDEHKGETGDDTAQERSV